jgi:hypothetical protein
MHVASKRNVAGSVALLILLAAVALFAAFQPNAQAAKKPKADFQIDLFVTGMLPSEVVARVEKIAAASQHPTSMTPAFNVDSFFDITYSIENSSGVTGLAATSFVVDSFFDITYSIDPKRGDTGTWDTEMVALSLTGIFGDPDFDVAAPEHVLAAISSEVRGTAREPHEYVGHVTLLR